MAHFTKPRRGHYSPHKDLSQNLTTQELFTRHMSNPKNKSQVIAGLKTRNVYTHLLSLVYLSTSPPLPSPHPLGQMGSDFVSDHLSYREVLLLFL